MDPVVATIVRGGAESFGTTELAFELGKFMGLTSIDYPRSADAMWNSAAVMYDGPDHAQLWSSYVNGWNYAISTYTH